MLWSPATPTIPPEKSWWIHSFWGMHMDHEDVWRFMKIYEACQPMSTCINTPSPRWGQPLHHWFPLWWLARRDGILTSPQDGARFPLSWRWNSRCQATDSCKGKVTSDMGTRPVWNVGAPGNTHFNWSNTQQFHWLYLDHSGFVGRPWTVQTIPSTLNDYDNLIVYVFICLLNSGDFASVYSIPQWKSMDIKRSSFH